MTSSSFDTPRGSGRAKPPLGRKIFPLVISFGVLVGGALTSPPRLAPMGSNRDFKEALIERMLTSLGDLYSTNLKLRGKTFDVVIRDFSPEDDEETYAIIDELERFWVINLPGKTKWKTLGVEGICVCKELSLRKVREDLVSATRNNGLRRQFTVPGSGSGGAVRLVATRLEGSGGSIDVTGGTGLGQFTGNGGFGRIRLEFFESTLAANFSIAPSVASPSSVFLTNPPVLQISSVGGISPPAMPSGNFATPDVILPLTTTNPVMVNIAASQIPLGTAVNFSGGFGVRLE
ncbi:MAG: hypothetical protein ACREJA_00045 [Candidatus Methylomirabilales bacterium]